MSISTFILFTLWPAFKPTRLFMITLLKRAPFLLNATDNARPPSAEVVIIVVSKYFLE